MLGGTGQISLWMETLIIPDSEYQLLPPPKIANIQRMLSCPMLSFLPGDSKEHAIHRAQRPFPFPQMIAFRTTQKNHPLQVSLLEYYLLPNHIFLIPQKCFQEYTSINYFKLISESQSVFTREQDCDHITSIQDIKVCLCFCLCLSLNACVYIRQRHQKTLGRYISQ